MALISPSRRLRRTPFSEGVEAAGVKGYTVYNRMLLPTVFRSIEEDYHHLKQAVQVWDVACERQIELRGPDAGRLMQMLTPRDLRGMLPGQCYYVPIVDETGGMLNDPVAVSWPRTAGGSRSPTATCCSGSRGWSMASGWTCWSTSPMSARWRCRGRRRTT